MRIRFHGARRSVVCNVSIVCNAEMDDLVSVYELKPRPAGVPNVNQFGRLKRIVDDRGSGSYRHGNIR